MNKVEVLHREFDIINIKNNYKKVVWFYDLWSWLTESKAAKYVIEFAEINNGESILEVACGTGVVFEQIVKRNPKGTNIGVDLSPDMLNKAKKRLKNIGHNNYELREANALKLDIVNNSIDLIINNFMIDLMPIDTFDDLAQEFYRLIKPNGKVVISTFSFGKKRINKLWFWIAKTIPDLLTSCRPVSFKENLIKAGFRIENHLEISQNTFPSEIIKAIKV